LEGVLKKLAGALFVGALALAGCGDDDGEASSETTAPVTSTSTTGSTTTAGPVKAGLDAAYGKQGVSATPLSTTEHDRFMAVAVAPDGKIYGAGFVNQGGDQAMAVARIDATGALDKTFGTNGFAVANAAVGGKTAELARSVAIQSDGKIVIGGPIEHDTKATGDAAKDTDAAVARFDNTGKLDTTFGKGGIAIIDFGTGKATSATAYVGDTSWGLGVAGDRVVVFGSKLAAGADRVDTDFVLAALNKDGVLDTTFGTGGMVTVDSKGNGVDNPRNLIVQSDGKIVATGYSRDGDGVVSPVLIRTSATGQLDSAFGTNGLATAKVLPGVAESYSLSQQGDKYVLAGYGRGADANEKVDLIVYRFTGAGQWDSTFGTNGITRIDIAKEDDRARTMTVLPDQRILAVGSGKQTAANIDGMLVLLSKDGAPVTDFGTGGNLISDLGGPADAWYGVAVSSDKKSVIVAGYKGTDAASGGNDDAVVARVLI
jgi:uncharacterized delta-60 repeat protein